MSLLMLLCPLGMATMGGVARLLTRLPGSAQDGLRRMAWRSTRLPLPASRPQPADEGRERKSAVSDA
jgi:hypothetical protein